VALSNSPRTGLADLDLEDFALGELAGQREALRHQPGYAILREEIWREGFESGLAQARQEGEAERQKLIADGLGRLQALLADLGAARAGFHAQNEQEIARLAMALARRILRAESGVDPAILMERLKDCLRHLEKESSYLIKVQPDRVAALSALIRESGEDPLGGLPYRIVGDPRLPAGSLVLEGESARVESICEDELARLEAHVLELCGRPGAGDGH